MYKKNTLNNSVHMAFGSVHPLRGALKARLSSFVRFGALCEPGRRAYNSGQNVRKYRVGHITSVSIKCAAFRTNTFRLPITEGSVD
jgi:hypothetical protein